MYVCLFVLAGPAHALREDFRFLIGPEGSPRQSATSPSVPFEGNNWLRQHPAVDNKLVFATAPGPTRLGYCARRAMPVFRVRIEMGDFGAESQKPTWPHVLDMPLVPLLVMCPCFASAQTDPRDPVRSTAPAPDIKISPGD